jgi:hypothetical protein
MMPENLAIIVNKPIGEWQDGIQQSLEDIIKWVNRIVCQTPEESRIKKDRCEICNSKEKPFDLELHHIGHERFWPDMRITACIVNNNCHGIFSERQMMHEHLLRIKNPSEELKIAIFLMDLQDILSLKADRTGNSNYRILARKYTPMIREYMRGFNG